MIPTRNSLRLLLGQLNNLHTKLQETQTLFKQTTEQLKAIDESDRIYEANSPYYTCLMNQVSAHKKLHKLTHRIFQIADRYVVGRTDSVCKKFDMKIRQYTPISPGKIEFQFQSLKEMPPEKLQHFFAQVEREKQSAESVLTEQYPGLFTLHATPAANTHSSESPKKKLKTEE